MEQMARILITYFKTIPLRMFSLGSVCLRCSYFTKGEHHSDETGYMPSFKISMKYTTHKVWTNVFFCENQGAILLFVSYEYPK